MIMYIRVFAIHIHDNNKKIMYFHILAQFFYSRIRKIYTGSSTIATTTQHRLSSNFHTLYIHL